MDDRNANRWLAIYAALLVNAKTANDVTAYALLADAAYEELKLRFPNLDLR